MRKKLLKCVQNNLNLVPEVPRVIVCRLSRKEVGFFFFTKTRKGVSIEGQADSTPFQIKCVFDKKTGVFSFRYKIKSPTLGWQGTVSPDQDTQPDLAAERLHQLLIEIIEELRV